MKHNTNQPDPADYLAREAIADAVRLAAGQGRAEAFRLLLAAYDAAVEGVRDESTRSRPIAEYFDGTADAAMAGARIQYQTARRAVELFACGGLS